MGGAYRLLRVAFTAFNAACPLLFLGLFFGIAPNIVMDETRLPDGTVIGNSTLNAESVLVYWVIGAGLLGALMLLLRRGLRR